MYWLYFFFKTRWPRKTSLHQRGRTQSALAPTLSPSLWRRRRPSWWSSLMMLTLLRWVTIKSFSERCLSLCGIYLYGVISWNETEMCSVKWNNWSKEIKIWIKFLKFLRWSFEYSKFWGSFFVTHHWGLLPLTLIFISGFRSDLREVRTCLLLCVVSWF